MSLGASWLVLGATAVLPVLPVAGAGLPGAPAQTKAPAPAAPDSVWLGEIGKLIQAGAEEQVVLAFIDNTEGTFNLDPARISKLTQWGASPGLIAAMIQHDRAIAAGSRPLVATTTPPVRLFPKLPPLPPDPGPAGEESRSIVVPLEGRSHDPESVEVGPGSALRSSKATIPVPSRRPVPLTDTILMYRGVVRSPNLFVVYSPAAAETE